MTIFFFVFIFISSLTSDGHCYDASPKCFKLLESEFFSRTPLYQTLEMHNVSQSSWLRIYNDLKNEEKDSHQILRKRARKIRPDPTKNPFNPEQSLELFRQIALEKLTVVMQKYNYHNSNGIKEMIEYIESSHHQIINECLGVFEEEEDSKQTE